MDFIELYTENREFKIQLSKVKKPFSYSNFAKYICSITFKNSINDTIFKIDCSEKEFLDCMQSLNEFIMNIGTIISDNIYFNSNINSFFIYVSTLENAYLEQNVEYQSNIDEDFFIEEKLQMSIYENSIRGNVLRLYFEMSYSYLEDFIYKMYLIIEDIPYLEDMSNLMIMEFMNNN